MSGKKLTPDEQMEVDACVALLQDDADFDIFSDETKKLKDLSLACRVENKTKSDEGIPGFSGKRDENKTNNEKKEINPSQLYDEKKEVEECIAGFCLDEGIAEFNAGGEKDKEGDDHFDAAVRILEELYLDNITQEAFANPILTELFPENPPELNKNPVVTPQVHPLVTPLILNSAIVNSMIAFLHYLDYESETKLFVHDTRKFKYIAICGHVIDIRPKSESELQYFLVDDGTGSIRVFAEDLKPEFAEKKAAVRKGIETAVRPLKNDCSLSQMKYVFLWNSDKISKSSPNMSEVKIGDLVHVHGKLCEYMGHRQIFLKHLRTISNNITQFRSDWLYSCLRRVGENTFYFNTRS